MKTDQKPILAALIAGSESFAKKETLFPAAVRPTPGPWEIRDGLIYGIEDGASYLVCDVVGDPSAAVNEQDEANARLIAAAPELMEACKQMLKWIDCGCDPSGKSLASARAAIAKAEGRQS